ncbi:MAG: hypothetical protein M0Z41_19095 [Peptococcaceae bacterium]|jgi:hypothetical protein|nr:hypothetical protein [Peptococcaceae bacterium]
MLKVVLHIDETEKWPVGFGAFPEACFKCPNKCFKRRNRIARLPETVKDVFLFPMVRNFRKILTAGNNLVSKYLPMINRDRSW